MSGPFSGYSPDKPQPLTGYSLFVAAFNGLFGLFLWRARRGQRLPARWSLGDLLLLGVATHQLSLLIAKDKVTAVFRAPFARFEKTSGGPYVQESARGSGLQRAVGELVT